MSKVYIVHMEEDEIEWNDTYAYADRKKAEERMEELSDSHNAWYYDIEEFEYVSKEMKS